MGWIVASPWSTPTLLGEGRPRHCAHYCGQQSHPYRNYPWIQSRNSPMKYLFNLSSTLTPASSSLTPEPPTHLWNRCQDFSSYRRLSCEEQEQDKVLGVNGKPIKPIGIGTVLLKIEDDLNHIHTLEIQDVRHMPDIPLNIFAHTLLSNNANPREIPLRLAPLMQQG